MTTNQGNATLVEKINNNAVILNGVSPWAKAGAKRSESLTETWAEAVGVMARAFHQTASAHGESAILHSGLVRKASQACVQNDGRFGYAVARSFLFLLLVLLLCFQRRRGGEQEQEQEKG